MTSLIKDEVTDYFHEFDFKKGIIFLENGFVK